MATKRLRYETAEGLRNAHGYETLRYENENEDENDDEDDDDDDDDDK